MPEMHIQSTKSSICNTTLTIHPQILHTMIQVPDEVDDIDRLERAKQQVHENGRHVGIFGEWECIPIRKLGLLWRLLSTMDSDVVLPASPKNTRSTIRRSFTFNPLISKDKFQNQSATPIILGKQFRSSF